MSRVAFAWMVTAMMLPCLVPGAAHSAGDTSRSEGWYALAVVPPRPRADLPVIAGIDWSQVAAAEGVKGWKGEVARGDVRAALEGPAGRLTPVPCQYDAAGPAKGTVTLLVPASPAEQRVRLWPVAAWAPEAVRAGGAEAEGGAAPPRVIVTKAGKAVTVDNGYVRVTFDPAKQGGLPSRWVFDATGKAFEAFDNNDAVYTKDAGRLQLRYDPSPKVEVVAGGPLRAAIRVTAHYVDQDGKEPASAPQAVYDYSFFPGSPYILLSAHISQKSDFAWSELHIVEINFQGQDFTHYANSTGVHELKADKKSYSDGTFSALLDGPKGPDVLAIVGDSRIYDGRGGYGTYLHGPWLSWGTRSTDADVTLYAAGDAGALKRLSAAAPALRAARARVSTPGLEAGLAALREAKDAAAPRWHWAAALLATMAAADLPAAARLAPSAAEACRAGGDALAWLGKNIAGGTFLERGGLGMAWQRGTDGVARMVSLFNLKTGQELLAPGSPPLWALTAKGADGKAVSVSGAAPAEWLKADEGAGLLRVEWRPLRGVEGVTPADADRLVVGLTAQLTEAGRLDLSLVVKNDTSLSLDQVTWPGLILGPMSPGGQKDTFVAALSSGKMWRHPYDTGAAVGGALYPNGWEDIPLFILYAPEGGVAVMAQDPDAYMKYVDASADPARRAMRMDFRWPAPNETLPRNSFALPGRIEIAPLGAGQDWYDAAMIYRAWAAKEAKWWPDRGKPGRPDTPQWMRDLPAWVQANGAPSECVDAVLAFRKYLGVPCGFHWYSWHKIRFDTHYPHYFPAKPGFAAAVKELQQAGVRVMPYINGRLWDTGNADFATKAFPAACKNQEGKNYVEEYGSGAKLAPMCPTTPLWQHTIQGIVERLVGPEYNVDGVYIDQVAAAAPAPCFDKTHGHTLGGGDYWTVDGYWKMLGKLQADLARQYPDKMLTTECTAEPYLKCFDGYLSWSWQENNAVPLFPAIYGDKIRLFGRAYNAAGDVSMVRRMKMAQQLVFGEQIGWMAPDIIKDKKAAPYLREVVQTRWRLRDYFRGRMMRPPSVVGKVEKITGDWQWGGVRMVTMEAVQAGAFRAVDGRVAVIATNFSYDPQEFDLKMPVKDWGVRGATSVHLRLKPGEVWTLELHK